MGVFPEQPVLDVAADLTWLSAVRAAVAARPLVVGLSGPQGAGKSTRAAAWVAALRAEGARAVALSVDDFYLTRGAQLAVAAAHPGNPYLEHRGYPGTHDIALGAQTLDALTRSGPGRVTVPTYGPVPK